MKMTVFLTWFLLFSISSVFAAGKPKGGKTSGGKSRLNNPTESKADRTKTNQKAVKEGDQRRGANPNAKVTKQNIVDAQTLSMAKVSIGAKDVKSLDVLVQYASGKNVSLKHKKLAESYITLLAEANEKFTVINTDIVLSAVQKWGESEATNLGKIFEKTQSRVKEGSEVNEAFKDILKELGIEDAFKNFC